MPDLQFIIVSLIVIGAAMFASAGLYRRSRAFSSKPDCEADCGCSGKTKTTIH